MPPKSISIKLDLDADVADSTIVENTYFAARSRFIDCIAAKRAGTSSQSNDSPRTHPGTSAIEAVERSFLSRSVGKRKLSSDYKQGSLPLNFQEIEERLYIGQKVLLAIILTEQRQTRRPHLIEAYIQHAKVILDLLSRLIASGYDWMTRELEVLQILLPPLCSGLLAWLNDEKDIGYKKQASSRLVPTLLRLQQHLQALVIDSEAGSSSRKRILSSECPSPTLKRPRTERPIAGANSLLIFPIIEQLHKDMKEKQVPRDPKIDQTLLHTMALYFDVPSETILGLISSLKTYDPDTILQYAFENQEKLDRTIVEAELLSLESNRTTFQQLLNIVTPDRNGEYCLVNIAQEFGDWEGANRFLVALGWFDCPKNKGFLSRPHDASPIGRRGLDEIRTELKRLISRTENLMMEARRGHGPGFSLVPTLSRFQCVMIEEEFTVVQDVKAHFHSLQPLLRSIVIWKRQKEPFCCEYFNKTFDTFEAYREYFFSTKAWTKNWDDPTVASLPTFNSWCWEIHRSVVHLIGEISMGFVEDRGVPRDSLFTNRTTDTRIDLSSFEFLQIVAYRSEKRTELDMTNPSISENEFSSIREVSHIFGSDTKPSTAAGSKDTAAAPPSASLRSYMKEERDDLSAVPFLEELKSGRGSGRLLDDFIRARVASLPAVYTKRLGPDIIRFERAVLATVLRWTGEVDTAVDVAHMVESGCTIDILVESLAEMWKLVIDCRLWIYRIIQGQSRQAVSEVVTRLRQWSTFLWQISSLCHKVSDHDTIVVTKSICRFLERVAASPPEVAPDIRATVDRYRGGVWLHFFGLQLLSHLVTCPLSASNRLVLLDTIVDIHTHDRARAEPLLVSPLWCEITRGCLSWIKETEAPDTRVAIRVFYELRYAMVSLDMRYLSIEIGRDVLYSPDATKKLHRAAWIMIIYVVIESIGKKSCDGKDRCVLNLLVRCIQEWIKRTDIHDKSLHHLLIMLYTLTVRSETLCEHARQVKLQDATVIPMSDLIYQWIQSFEQLPLSIRVSMLELIAIFVRHNAPENFKQADLFVGYIMNLLGLYSCFFVQSYPTLRIEEGNNVVQEFVSRDLWLKHSAIYSPQPYHIEDPCQNLASVSSAALTVVRELQANEKWDAIISEKIASTVESVRWEDIGSSMADQQTLEIYAALVAVSDSPVPFEWTLRPGQVVQNDPFLISSQRDKTYPTDGIIIETLNAHEQHLCLFEKRGSLRDPSPVWIMKGIPSGRLQPSSLRFSTRITPVNASTLFSLLDSCDAAADYLLSKSDNGPERLVLANAIILSTLYTFENRSVNGTLSERMQDVVLTKVSQLALEELTVDPDHGNHRANVPSLHGIVASEYWERTIEISKRIGEIQLLLSHVSDQSPVQYSATGTLVLTEEAEPTDVVDKKMDEEDDTQSSDQDLDVSCYSDLDRTSRNQFSGNYATGRLPDDSVFASSVSQLTDMGFSIPVSTHALRLYSGDLSAAVQWLLDDNTLDERERIDRDGPDAVQTVATPQEETIDSDERAAVIMFIQNLDVLTSPALLEAFTEIPFSEFIPSFSSTEALQDAPIKIPKDITLPSLSTIANCFDALDLQPGLRVLDVGTGCGFCATLLAHLVKDSGYCHSIDADRSHMGFAMNNIAKFSKANRCGEQRESVDFKERIYLSCRTIYSLEPAELYDRILVLHVVSPAQLPYITRLLTPNGRLVYFDAHHALSFHRNVASPVCPLKKNEGDVLPEPTASEIGGGFHEFLGHQSEIAGIRFVRELTALHEDPWSSSVSSRERMAYSLGPGALVRLSKPRPEAPCERRGTIISQYKTPLGSTVMKFGYNKSRIEGLTPNVKISTDGFQVSNRGSFGTVRANVAVRGGGKWFYEVRLGSSKVIQIGWVVPNFDPNPDIGHGVGDDDFSWAYDGGRRKKWHGGQIGQDYSTTYWRPGDVVGCLLDLDVGTMSFMLNGQNLGIAFENLEMEDYGGYSPACSMDGGEHVIFNLGKEQFVFPPPASYRGLCDSTDSSTVVKQYLQESLVGDPLEIMTMTGGMVTVKGVIHGQVAKVDREVLRPADYHIAMFLENHIVDYTKFSTYKSLKDMYTAILHELRRNLAIIECRIVLPNVFKTFYQAQPRIPRAPSAFNDLIRLAKVCSRQSMSDTITTLVKLNTLEETRHTVRKTTRLFTNLWVPIDLFLRNSETLDPKLVGQLISEMSTFLQASQASTRLVQSPHPLRYAGNVMLLSRTLKDCAMRIRNGMYEGATFIRSGNPRRAINNFTESIERGLEGLYRDGNKHAIRCHDQLKRLADSITERIEVIDRTATRSTEATKREFNTYAFRLRDAMHKFLDELAPHLRTPVFRIERNKISIPTASSLEINFDVRMKSLSGSLRFFADSNCTRRIPWLQSRDGHYTIIIPSNTVYYTYDPDEDNPHPMAVEEWGYGLRIQPFTTNAKSDRMKLQVPVGWELLDLISTEPAVLKQCAQHESASEFVMMLLQYLQTPGAPAYRRVAKFLTLIMLDSVHLNLNAVRLLQPELSDMYRSAAGDGSMVYFRPKFQELLQIMLVYRRLVRNADNVALTDSPELSRWKYYINFPQWIRRMDSVLSILDRMLDGQELKRHQKAALHTNMTLRYSRFAMLKHFIRVFENSLRPTAQIPRWGREKRHFWVRQVDSATHPVTLSILVLRLQDSLTLESREMEWLDKRGKWLNNMASAASVEDVARQLIPLERYIDNRSHFDTWNSRRSDWHRGVRDLAEESSKVIQGNDKMIRLFYLFSDNADEDTGNLLEDNSEVYMSSHGHGVTITASVICSVNHTTNSSAARDDGADDNQISVPSRHTSGLPLTRVELQSWISGQSDLAEFYQRLIPARHADTRRREKPPPQTADKSRFLIRKIILRQPTSQECLVSCGLIFVFDTVPSERDQLRMKSYDHFTAEHYQAYLKGMYNQKKLPKRADPIAFFELPFADLNPWNDQTIVLLPDFAVLGRYVVIKLLRSYKTEAIDALEPYVYHMTRNQVQELGTTEENVPIWCYYFRSNWVPYSNQEINTKIENSFVAYTLGDVPASRHCLFQYDGMECVVDFEEMKHCIPKEASFQSLETLEQDSMSQYPIRRVCIPKMSSAEIFKEHLYTMEYIGFTGLRGKQAKKFHETWTNVYYSRERQGIWKRIRSNDDCHWFLVLTDQHPVYDTPTISHSSKIIFSLQKGERIQVVEYYENFGRIKTGTDLSEAWCILTSRTNEADPVRRIPLSEAAASGVLHEWNLDGHVVVTLPVVPADHELENIQSEDDTMQFKRSKLTELVKMGNQFHETNGRRVGSLLQSDLTEKLSSSDWTAFYALRYLNDEMSLLLPFIGLGPISSVKGTLTELIHRCTREFLFLQTKMQVWEKLWSRMYSNERSSKVVELNRYRAGELKSRLTEGTVTNYSDSVFVQLFTQLWKVPPNLLRRLDGRAWFSKFVREPAIDDGGLYRETISTICDELNSSCVPIFVPCSNGLVNQGMYRETLVANQCCTGPPYDHWYQFVGRLMGIATQNLQAVFPLNLSPYLWRLLVNERPELNDLVLFDLATFRTVEYIRNFKNSEEFTQTFHDTTFTSICCDTGKKMIELIPNGKDIIVTFDRKDEFAAALEQFRLHQFDFAIRNIKIGLHSIVPERLLHIFTAEELQVIVCGRDVINVELLQRKTEYCAGMDRNGPLVSRFWRVLKSFNRNEHQQFLQFVWGRSRMPFSEVDFGTSTFKLVRHVASSSNPDAYLPVAHTCFFQLELPNYSSDAILKKRLKYAMINCAAIIDEGQIIQLGTDDRS